MNEWIGYLLLAGMAPLIAALWRNWLTPLRASLLWACAAIAIWGLAAILGSDSLTYVALALTGCAGVAVLGARRPGNAAWNFVVVGLLSVLLVPLAEGAVLGTTLQLGTVRTIFLIVLLGTVVLNYLPTRFGLAAGLVGLGAAGTFLYGSGDRVVWPFACLAAAPWAGWLSICRRRGRHEFDRNWQSFRDRYGAIWALRVREQFNRSAANAGRSERLGWNGLVGQQIDEALEVLRALTSRFGPESV